MVGFGVWDATDVDDIFGSSVPVSGGSESDDEQEIRPSDRNADRISNNSFCIGFGFFIWR